MTTKCCDNCRGWAYRLLCMDNKCSCHKSAETIEIAEYSSGRITANGIEVVSATDTAERECPICGRTSNLVALDKDCPFCYPNRDDISMVGIDVKPVKDLDWPTDTAEKKCDNNCLTFIKNGLCLHTGYLTTDTAEKHGHPGMGPCVCKQCQPTTDADQRAIMDDTSDWRERLKDEIPNMHEPFRQRHVDN